MPSFGREERILTRFGGTAEATEKRRRGRRASTAPAAGRQRSARGGQQAPKVSMSDGILKAVQAHGDGATANAVLDYLSREFGMTVRPNHLGIALAQDRVIDDFTLKGKPRNGTRASVPFRLPERGACDLLLSRFA
jgi:hypothetical protein